MGHRQIEGVVSYTVCNKFIDLLSHRDFFVKIIESFLPQGKEHGERERERQREACSCCCYCWGERGFWEGLS